MTVEIAGRDLAPPLRPFWWLAHLDLVREDLRWREGQRTWGLRHLPSPRSRRVEELRAARDRTLRAASLMDAYPTLQRDGEPVCARCCAPLVGRRRRWCSEACCEAATVRCNPGMARQAVYQRDRGICQRCGRDTKAARRALDRVRRDAERMRWTGPEGSRWWWGMVAGKLRRTMPRSAVRYEDRHHAWEMEHTTPVVEGGGLCGLDGLTTLCIPCHRESTAQLAARRAAAVRPQMEIPIGA